MAEQPQCEEPIYEVLRPGKCLLLSKNQTHIIYAVNEGGFVHVKQAPLP